MSLMKVYYLLQHERHEWRWRDGCPSRQREQNTSEKMLMRAQEVTHVTFIKLERVCLSLPVSSQSPCAVSCLSSYLYITECKHSTKYGIGRCHVILLRWRTGVEHLSIISAHAGWPTHVRTPITAVTVMLMTRYGEIFWLTRQSFQ